jgi:hypothetical protein
MLPTQARSRNFESAPVISRQEICKMTPPSDVQARTGDPDNRRWRYGIAIALLTILVLILIRNHMAGNNNYDLPVGSHYYTGPMLSKPKDAMLPKGPPQFPVSSPQQQGK